MIVSWHGLEAFYVYHEYKFYHLPISQQVSRKLLAVDRHFISLHLSRY